mmetsp:Transcript_47550/g.93828  ORF Transcript_47550/g.93828 Transcript_47550/m.93828 type:complete len:200 (-) Transcript_47550:1742-2341(-)
MASGNAERSGEEKEVPQTDLTFPSLTQEGERRHDGTQNRTRDRNRSPLLRAQKCPLSLSSPPWSSRTKLMSDKKKKQMGGMPTATHSLRVCDTHKVTHVTLFLSLFCHRLSDIHKHGGRRKELLCVRTANERSLPAYQRKRSEGRTWGVLPRCVHRLQNEDRCVSTVFIRESTGAPQKRGCKKKLGGQKDSRQVRSINR